MAMVLVAAVIGLVFGAGLHISQMTNPAKVLGFLDVTGAWDPSLAFVMGGALLVTAIGYRWVWRRPAPIFDSRFHIPAARPIDAALIAGAGLFGVGWGLVGICPGPALSTLFLGLWPIWLFTAAMLAGMGIMHTLRRQLQRRAAG